MLVELPPDVEANGGETQNHKTARLISISISIASAWRRSGIASRLMLSMQEELRKRACIWLTTSYTTRMPSWQSFESLLATCQWFAPEPRMLMSLGYCTEVVKAPWLSALSKALPGFELFE